MSRLTTLEASLAKKQECLNALTQTHMDSVREANGQPLNDKRNGMATMKRWDKQQAAISAQLKEIEKTETAIEDEQDKLAEIAAWREILPQPLLTAIDSGEIVQWRRHPNRFFVSGVPKARIVWDEKTGKLSSAHANNLAGESHDKFNAVFCRLKKEIL